MGVTLKMQSFDGLTLFRNERDPGTRKAQRTFDGQTAVSQPPSLPPAIGEQSAVVQVQSTI